MKILIDARMYGPEHTGNGVYTKKLVENLVSIDKKNEYLILLREDKYNELSFPQNWQKIKADFRHYTFAEQIMLPLIISKFKPDLVHFPHFNVPLLFFGKYIVTIHDLIMHKFKGGEATTRPFPIYQIWRLGYYISFAKAVLGSVGIIVPSNAVKKDLLSYYRIDGKKINVIYE
jgi:glycosyltransferase involved in cell wall biosynthesis